MLSERRQLPSLICISQARSQRGPASPKPLPVAVTAVKHPKGLSGTRCYRKTVRLDSRFEFHVELGRSHFRAPHEPFDSWGTAPKHQERASVIKTGICYVCS